MLEIKGTCCKDIKVFTDNVETEAVELLHKLSDSEAYRGKRIRVMPDCHLGKGAVIGFSCPIDLDTSMLSPSTVGVDIGCTVSATFYDATIPKDKIAEIEHKVRQTVHFGCDTQETSLVSVKDVMKAFNKAQSRLVSAYPIFSDHIIGFNREKDLEAWLARLHMDFGRFLKSIGTVGSGNHFVEFDANDELGKYAVVVHCGSRNLGQKVCSYWEHVADSTKPTKDEWASIVKSIKATTSNKKDIKAKIEAARADYLSKHLKGYLSGGSLLGYLVDMLLCQEYARLNHEVIHGIIEGHLEKLGLHKTDFISSTHNYIDFDFTASSGSPFMCIRKGAIRAYKGEKCLIPFNMRDGLAVCEGKSNEDWNCTAPHGCGRALSRTKAKHQLNVEDFKATMEAARVYTTTADASTLDEAPMAYKPYEEIVKLIEPTVNVLYLMKPVFNIKGGNYILFDPNRVLFRQ